MAIAEWISLVSSIGACGAAIVALLTLFELYRQRASSYKPDLTVIQKQFILSGNGSRINHFVLDWKETEEEENTPLLPIADIPVVNVGFGAAKNVHVVWHYDMESLIENINRMAQESHQAFYIKRESFMLSFESKTIGSLSINARMNESDFEYILPLQQDISGQNVPLPPAYTFLMSIFLSLVFITQKKFDDQYKMPVLKMQLAYSDIGGKTHTSNQNLYCHVQMATVAHPVRNPEGRTSIHVRLVTTAPQ